MDGLNKGIRKAELAIKWDPSPAGEPATDLDIVAATYLASAPHGNPDYVVYFGSRSPDGTIYLNRDSKDGKGFGWDEVMTRWKARGPMTSSQNVTARAYWSVPKVAAPPLKSSGAA